MYCVFLNWNDCAGAKNDFSSFVAYYSTLPTLQTGAEIATLTFGELAMTSTLRSD